DDIAFFSEERNKIGVRTGDVRAVFFHVEVGSSIFALGPIGAHEDPRAGFDATLLFFPVFDKLRREKKVGVFCDFVGYVNDASWGEKFCDGNVVGRVVGVILAGDPMDGRVEMGAGVFAGGKVVPVPGGSAAVVA